MIPKVKNTLQGLTKMKTVEDINVEINNGNAVLKLPDRQSKFLRNSFELSQLDGEGARQLDELNMNLMKEQEKQIILRSISINSNGSISHGEARASQHSNHSFHDPDDDESMPHLETISSSSKQSISSSSGTLMGDVMDWYDDTAQIMNEGIRNAQQETARVQEQARQALEQQHQQRLGEHSIIRQQLAL
eukprot:5472047-Amphidinium_carterae.1